MNSTTGTGTVLMSEVLTKVNNAKDKPKKIAVLRDYDNAPLRMVLKGAFDPNIKWALPSGTPPYIANEAPKGTEHGLLRQKTMAFCRWCRCSYYKDAERNNVYTDVRRIAPRRGRTSTRYEE